MFHVVGSTPEASTLDAALQRREPDAVEVVTLAELRAARAELTTAAGDALGAVSIGTPHASAAELARYATLLDGRRISPGIELLVSTGRDVLAEAAEHARALETAGATLLTDTCSYIAPMLRPTRGAVMTDSAKWAYYAPGNIGASVIFASTEDCIESAVTGRVVHDEATWR
jgi:predicted aconitase